MKKENGKMFWALGIIAALGVLTIAFATLSTNLKIVGTGNVNTFGVEFNNSSADNNSWYSVGKDGSPSVEQITGSEKSTSTTALAIGQGGVCSVQSTDGNRNNSLAITGTEFYEYGAYIVYKVTVTNYASNSMKLSGYNVQITKNGSASDPDLSSKVSSDLYTSTALSSQTLIDHEHGYYGDEHNNYITLGAASINSTGAATPDSSTGSATLYLKIKRTETIAENEVAENGSVTIVVTPSWVAN